MISAFYHITSAESTALRIYRYENFVMIIANSVHARALRARRQDSQPRYPHRGCWRTHRYPLWQDSQQIPHGYAGRRRRFVRHKIARRPIENNLPSQRNIENFRKMDQCRTQRLLVRAFAFHKHKRFAIAHNKNILRLAKTFLQASSFPTGEDLTERPFAARRQNVRPTMLHISFSWR